jgi:hypothetical protein
MSLLRVGTSNTPGPQFLHVNVLNQPLTSIYSLSIRHGYSTKSDIVLSYLSFSALSSASSHLAATSVVITEEES